MVAPRSRSWRIASDLPSEKKPTKLSQPVFDRISSKSREKPAVTSSSPMISSAMLAFMISVCLWTSSSVAFSMSMAMSCPAFSFTLAESIFEVSSEIFACAAATCFWLSRIWVSKSDIRLSNVNVFYTML